MVRLNVGLPRMHKEAGERRDFLPAFVESLGRMGAGALVLEHGYGSGMGFGPRDYARLPGVRFGSYEECLAQDIVVVVRCPHDAALARMRPGSLLVSMLHFGTRPQRVSLLERLGLQAVSMDALVDDDGRRVVENLQAVAWNGVSVVFGELGRSRGPLDDPGRGPIRVTVMGTGGVGGHAAHAATRYGDTALHERLAARRVAGVEVCMIDHDLTGNRAYMLERLASSDILVDATRRAEPWRPVVPNEWIEPMPAHAILLDLSADPYDSTASPPLIKGIEGVPHGNLDQFVFFPNDPAYDELPPEVARDNRRIAVSCYSWPGLTPRSCMARYCERLEPFMAVLVRKPVRSWDPDARSAYERALTRAELGRWRRARV